MRISDWSSDVCPSDLAELFDRHAMRRIDRRHYRVLQRLDDNLQLKIEVGDHLSTSASASRSWTAMPLRSEERRVGKESGRTGRYRWPPHPEKQHHDTITIDVP